MRPALSSWQPLRNTVEGYVGDNTQKRVIVLYYASSLGEDASVYRYARRSTTERNALLWHTLGRTRALALVTSANPCSQGWIVSASIDLFLRSRRLCSRRRQTRRSTCTAKLEKERRSYLVPRTSFAKRRFLLRKWTVMPPRKASSKCLKLTRRRKLA